MMSLFRRGIAPALLLSLVSVVFLSSSGFAADVGTEAARTARLDAQDDELRREIMDKVQQQLQRTRENLMRNLDRIIREALEERDRGALQRAQRRIAELEDQIAELRRGGEGRQAERRQPGADRREREPERAAGAGPSVILGFGFEQTDAALARKLGADPGKCLQVSSVIDGSPAAKVGLRPGDLITRADGVEASPERFLELMQSKRPGDAINLNVVRDIDGNRIQIEAKTEVVSRAEFADAIRRLEGRGEADRGERPDAPESPRRPEPRGDFGQGPVRLGVSIEQTDDFRLNITDVESGSNAAEAGLKVGDQLLGLAGDRTRTLDDVKGALDTLRPGREATIKYRRGEQEFVATLIVAGRGGQPRLVSSKEAERVREPAREERGKPEAGARKRAFLGVQLDTADDGVAIMFVQPGTAADSMGLKSGDVITAMNGRATRNLDALREVLSGIYAGDDLTVKVRRDGETRTLKGKAGARDESQARSESPEPAARAVTGSEGTGAESKGPGSLGVMAVETDQGVKVDELLPGSAAAAAGLRVGDVIVKAGSTSVGGFDALRQGLAHKSAGDIVTLSVRRNGIVNDMSVTLAPAVAVASAGTTMARSASSQTTPPRASSKAAPGYVGVTVEEQSEAGTIRIVAVEPGGPAARAGLQSGDEILAIEGSAVRELDRVRDLLVGLHAGDTATFRLSRDGRELVVSVTLGTR